MAQPQVPHQGRVLRDKIYDYDDNSDDNSDSSAKRTKIDDDNSGPKEGSSAQHATQ